VLLRNWWDPLSLSFASQPWGEHLCSLSTGPKWQGWSVMDCNLQTCEPKHTFSLYIRYLRYDVLPADVTCCGRVSRVLAFTGQSELAHEVADWCETKLVHKVGFIREKGKAGAVQWSPETGGFLLRWRLGFLWTFHVFWVLVFGFFYGHFNSGFG
jgi:hypothetical protein